MKNPFPRGNPLRAVYNADLKRNCAEMDEIAYSDGTIFFINYDPSANPEWRDHPPMDPPHWPLYTPEGQAWLRGWQRAFDEQLELIK